MITSKAAFAEGIKSGEIKEMTLCEFKVLKDGVFTVSSHKFSGQKRKVASANTVDIQLVNANAEKSNLSWKGDWEFAGHRLTITNEDAILIYVVNPLF